MKILLLAPQPFYQERGTPIAVDLILRALSARGDAVDVLTYAEGADVRYPGVTIHRLPQVPFTRGIGPGPSLKKILCDVVFFRAALRLAGRAQYELVHAVEESVFIARVIRRVHGIPYLYDMDSCLSEQIRAKYPALALPAAWLERWEAAAIRDAAAVVPVCDALAGIAEHFGARRIVLLRDISLLSLNNQAMNSGRPMKNEWGVDGPIVMYIGNLERYQGIDLLLESFAIARRHVPAAHLVVVGGDPQHIRRYEAVAKRLALGDHVHFVGPRPVAQMTDCVEAADVLVSPRLSGGNTPMKIYSYLASGKAILATDLPTHTQVLSAEVAVLRAPTPEAFADGLVRLLEDSALRRRLGAAASRLAEQRYSYSVFLKTFNDLYGDVSADLHISHPSVSAAKAGHGRVAQGLRLLVSAALLWLVMAKFQVHGVGTLMARMDWRFAVPALGLFLINRLVTTLEWQILLRAKGLIFPFRQLLRVVWVSNFFGHFLPAAVGGDSVRMVAMARRCEQTPEALSSVVVERLNGALSLAVLAAVGAWWSAVWWGSRTVLYAIALPFLGVSLIVLLLWTSPGYQFLTRVVSRFQRVPGHRFLVKVHEAVSAYRHQPWPVAASLLLSTWTHLNRVGAMYLLAKGMGIDLLLGEALVCVPTALFVAMLPISISGLGVRESALMLLLAPVGISTTEAFTLSLAFHLAALTSNLPGGMWSLWAMQSTGRPKTPRSADRPLRVLRVIDRLGYGDRLHGAGRVWLNSLPAFNNGREVIPCVLRLPASLERRFAQEGIRLRNLKKGRFNPLAIATLYRLIRRERVDVLHLEGYGASTFGRIAGILTGTPAIIHLHDMYGATPWYVRWCDWWLAPATARSVAVSEGVAEACATRLHIPRERIAVIPNAIPVGWVQPVAAEPLAQLRHALRIPQGSRVIGTVAHLQAEKDVPSLIEAVAHLCAAGRDCHVIVVGEGPDRAAIEQQIARLRLADRVHLVGFQPDVRPYLALMEVAVFSSLSEGCPNTLLEAMAMGRPIVATAARGIRELVRDGENGLLVQVGDSEAIAHAVGRLLAESTLAARLVAQVKQDAEAYQMPTHVRRLRHLYEDLVSEAHPSEGGRRDAS